MNTTTKTTVPAWTDSKALRRAVRRLNEQHMSYGAGFYLSTGEGGRFFKARANDGRLEVSDFETWTVVAQDKAQFHDHNGRELSITGGRS